MLQQEFEQMKAAYFQIFRQFYPAKRSNGFVERNLTVNFARAYEQCHKEENCFTWYELSFGNKKRMDGCIVNVTRKEIFLIESKRFNNPEKKKEEVKADICRIDAFDVAAEFSQRLPDWQDYTVYGVILADVWCEVDSKTTIFREFAEGTYESDLRDRGLCHYIAEFTELKSSADKWTAGEPGNTNRENYKILGFSWQR